MREKISKYFQHLYYGKSKWVERCKRELNWSKNIRNALFTFHYNFILINFPFYPSTALDIPEAKKSTDLSFTLNCIVF